MNILHVLLTKMRIPPQKYGGTERVLWGLIQGQRFLGHEVKVLVRELHGRGEGMIAFDREKTLDEQVEGWADIIHFHHPEHHNLKTPYVCTQHSNADQATTFPINTIFLSKKNAALHHADCYVHNGLLWADYGEPYLEQPKDYFHFLGKTQWRTKNIQGAVKIARGARKPLHVLGGRRINFKRNFYAYLGGDLHFHGMVGGEKKRQLIRHSAALLFPVLWHEPFGLAITESLYLGCPVIATPFGSLPEIINRPEIGFLSDSYASLIEAARNVGQFDRRMCHEYAKSEFDHLTMAKRYLTCYERVLAGETLNQQVPFTTESVKTMQTISA